MTERRFPAPWSIEDYNSACFIVRDASRAHWVKVKNPKTPAVKREAEEDWSV